MVESGKGPESEVTSSMEQKKRRKKLAVNPLSSPSFLITMIYIEAVRVDGTNMAAYIVVVTITTVNQLPKNYLVSITIMFLHIIINIIAM